MEPNTPIQTPPQVVVNQTQPKSKTPALVCTLCGVLAAAGIGFGVYGMFFQPKPTCEPAGQTSTSNTVADLSADEVKNLLNNTYKLGIRGSSYSNGLHKYFDNFDEDAKIIQLARLSEDILGESTYNSQEATNTFTISYESFNNRYHKLFGNSNDIEKKNYDLKNRTIGLISVNYNTSDDSFAVVYADGLGGKSTIDVFTKVISTSSTDDGVKATVATVTIDTEPKEKWELFNGNHWSGSGDEKYNIVDLSEEDLNKIYDSMKIYEFNFVKEDDGYKLSSITKL
jgi:hypothetical protein